MKNRKEALEHLAKGIDQIIADRAERTAEKADAPAEEVEGEESPEAGMQPEAGMESEMGAEGEEESMPEEEVGEEGEYGEKDQSEEMEQVMRELEEKMNRQPKGIRRQ